MFTLYIHTDGAAFSDDDGEDDQYHRNVELAGILETVALNLRNGRHGHDGHSQILHDANGNDVGRSKVHADRCSCEWCTILG